MGYAFMLGACCGCQKLFTFNPLYVPSIRVNGAKEPLCESCFNRWNEIHRTSKGLEPLPLNPQAYEPVDENEL